MDLTLKQKRFADEYIKNGGNATDAARKAGYKQPEAQGHENLEKSKITAYIARDKQSRIRKMELTL